MPIFCSPPVGQKINKKKTCHSAKGGKRTRKSRKVDWTSKPRKKEGGRD